VTSELQFNTSFQGASPFSPDRPLAVQFYGFFDYGRAYNLVPGSPDRTIASTGIGARSDVTPWMFVELEGLHRLTTHASGAAARPDGNFAVFSRIVLHQ
jgi:hemolysin activation/secretion protein